MRNAFVCFPQMKYFSSFVYKRMKLFLFAERQMAFVRYLSVIISFIFSKTRNDGCRHAQSKRFHANDLHIFDFHVSEFPSKNVRFFILEKYTQKYYFWPLR